MKTQKQRQAIWNIGKALSHLLDAFNVKHDFVIETKTFSNINLSDPIPDEPAGSEIEYRDDENQELQGVDHGEATHWMPLPAPPEVRP